MSSPILRVKIQDVLKDARNHTVTGIVLVALWVAVLPQYKETIESQRAVRHLAAFLQIKHLLAENPSELRFYVTDTPTLASSWSEVIPAPNHKTKDFKEYSPPNNLSSVKRCKEHWVPYPVGNSEMDVFFAKSRKCTGLNARLPDAKSTLINVDFTLDAAAAKHDAQAKQAYLYSIRANSGLLPFGDYKLVYTWRNMALPGALFVPKDPSRAWSEAESRQEIQANSGWCNVPARPMDINEDMLRRCYTAYILLGEQLEYMRLNKEERAPPASGQPDEAKNLATVAYESIHGPTMESYLATVPKYWNRAQGMLITEQGQAPALHSLKHDDPAVRQLVTKVLRNEGTADLAGVKVPISRLPWAISAFLAMISCLLYGVIASLRRVASNDVTEDFGWLMMQNRSTHGRLSAFISMMLVLIGAVALSWVVFNTASTAIELSEFEAFALLVTCATILAYGVMGIWLSIQQRRIANIATSSEPTANIKLLY